VVVSVSDPTDSRKPFCVSNKLYISVKMRRKSDAVM
jgi:hypothetical protein